MAYLPGDVTDAGKAGVGLSANAGSEIPDKTIEPQTYGPAENVTGPLYPPFRTDKGQVSPGHPFIPPGLDSGDNNTGSIPGGAPAQNEDEAGGG